MVYSAARLITQTRKRNHITHILMHLHWLPVKFRIQYKILLLVYKSLHGLAPQYLAELIIINCPTRSLRSSHGITLKVPKTRLKSYGDRSFSYAAAILWNQLPITIRAAPSVTIFKSSLKTLFFQKAYMWFPFIVQRQWALYLSGYQALYKSYLLLFLLISTITWCESDNWQKLIEPDSTDTRLAVEVYLLIIY